MRISLKENHSVMLLKAFFQRSNVVSEKGILMKKNIKDQYFSMFRIRKVFTNINLIFVFTTILFFTNIFHQQHYSPQELVLGDLQCASYWKTALKNLFFKPLWELTSAFQYKTVELYNFLNHTFQTQLNVEKFRIFIPLSTLHYYLDYFLYRREPNPKMTLKMLVMSALVSTSAMKVLT